MTSAALSGPVRGHHLPAAGFALVAVTLLLALPAAGAEVGRLAAVLVLQLGLVLAWVLVTGIQGFGGSLAVGAAAAVAADLVLVLSERPQLGDLLAVLGVGFVVVVLQQMLRRHRQDLVASLSGAVLLLCVVGALATLLLVGEGRSRDGDALVALLAVAAALLVGHGVDALLPRPRVAEGVPRGLAGLVLAVLAAAAAAYGTAVHLVPAYLDRAGDGAADVRAVVVSGAVLGLVAALAALAASYLVVETATSGTRSDDAEARSPWVRAVVQAALPIAACAPVAVALQTVL